MREPFVQRLHEPGLASGQKLGEDVGVMAEGDAERECGPEVEAEHGGAVGRDAELRAAAAKHVVRGPSGVQSITLTLFPRTGVGG